MALVELIKVDLEYRWLHRRLPRTIEEYLADHAELKNSLPADVIYEEYHVRSKAGEPLYARDYLARFPDRADELQRLFGLHPTDQSTALFAPSEINFDDMQPGDRIDDFDLLLLLGKGAFARVFLARQNSMQRLVALKVSADRGNEPQTLAQLDHESIVRVYDQRVLPEKKLRLLYMQYVSGGTLQGVVEAVRKTPATNRSGKLLLDSIEQALAARGETWSWESGTRNRWEQRGAASRHQTRKHPGDCGRDAEAGRFQHRLRIESRRSHPCRVLRRHAGLHVSGTTRSVQPGASA